MTPDYGQLPAEQCRLLMAGMAVGRVVYTLGALPAVLPVRFRLDHEGSVLLAVRGQPELVRAVRGAVVAFETGEVSALDGSGWSVTVLGLADVLPVEADVLPVEAQPAEPPSAGVDSAAPAADTAAQVLVRIRPAVVSGRRLAAHPADPVR